jgi:hypothetical protein
MILTTPTTPTDPGTPALKPVCFTYAKYGTEATITGLAATSLGATIIEIPATIEGNTVT